ncbi:MAG: hypothetical protein AM1032_000329 [Mycoplasmataceae bacterium]|nr:MAG: hypothetical protein AM1032_000329 [Mycoplasmataceae bacterium]
MLSKEEKKWLKEQLTKYNIKEDKSDEIFEEFDDFFENEIKDSEDEQPEQNKEDQLISEIKSLKEQINLINIQKDSELEKNLNFQNEVLDSFKIAFSELEILKNYHQNSSLKLEVLENHLKQSKFDQNSAKLNDQVKEIADEISDLEGTISNKKNEKSSLEGRKKEIENLCSNNKDSDEHKKLQAEIDKLNSELKKIEKELADLRRKNDDLKSKVNDTYQTLYDEIETVTESLNIKKSECERYIKLKWTNSISNIIEKKNNSDLISKLLQAQDEFTKNKSKLAHNLKTEIFNTVTSGKHLLEDLCKLRELLTQLELKKTSLDQIINSLKIVMTAPIMPSKFLEFTHDNIRDNFEENDDIHDYKYEYNKDEKFKKEINLSFKNELPFRSYNIVENKIEITEGKKGNYAILSYVWGGSRDKSKEKINDVWKNSNLNYQNDVTDLGYKSWLKAIEVCKLLEINYLWMDQLCINQAETTKEDQAEMEQEVSKMRQYYSNSSATLIAIQASLNNNEENSPEEILKKVIMSNWFTRSWTFQEGWLSKQTFFMFDNCSIDGNLLAYHWVLEQPTYSHWAKVKSFDDHSQKIATPLGWTYYQNGYTEEDSVSFSLNQALRTIKKRGRYLPIDGIYSVLGLLSYGNKVSIHYNKDKNGVCVQKYSKLELKKSLLSEIKSVHRKTIKRERKNRSFVIDSGIVNGEVTVINRNSYLLLNILCSSEIFDGRNKIKEGDNLLLLDKNEWKWNKAFILIVRKIDSIYQRIGLAEVSENDFDKLTEIGIAKKMTLNFDEKNLEVNLTSFVEHKE